MCLGEVCNLVNGDAYKLSDWSTSGTPIIRIQNLNDDNKPFNFWSGSLSDRVVVKPGDVLLAWSGTPGTSFGAHIWKRGVGVLNQHIFRVDFHGNSVIPEWAAFAINHQLDILIRKAHGGVGLRHVTKGEVKLLEIPLPPLLEQKRIAAILNEQMTVVERARASADAQLELTTKLIDSYLRGSLSNANVQRVTLSRCLKEVASGVGPRWRDYRVVGATRAGIAPAKENVGKKPEHYKLVEVGTIFYNPMRILLGSIAMIDDGDEAGITSPDYVVFRTEDGVLHPRWFYCWLRSPYGGDFIKTLTRGAVRERMLFGRLAAAEINVPLWSVQLQIADKLRWITIVRRSIAEQLETINKLPVALLRQAFAGLL